jgi:hypothetical protein
MFAEARKSEMDLDGLGKQLRNRKNELMNGSGRASGDRRRLMESLLGA